MHLNNVIVIITFIFTHMYLITHIIIVVLIIYNFIHIYINNILIIVSLPLSAGCERCTQAACVWGGGGRAAMGIEMGTAKRGERGRRSDGREEGESEDL